MGTQKNRLNETVLLSTQNIMLKQMGKKIFIMCFTFKVDRSLDVLFYAQKFCLSKPMSLPTDDLTPLTWNGRNHCSITFKTPSAGTKPISRHTGLVLSSNLKCLQICLFDLILYVPVNFFAVMSEQALSKVEPVLSKD